MPLSWPRKIGAVSLDRTVFYPLRSSQLGRHRNALVRAGASVTIVDTRYGNDGSIRHIIEESADMPVVGDSALVSLDWERRYLHMRLHTAMHLLGSMLHYGVTGCNISAEKSRLDFDIEATVEKEAVSAALLELAACRSCGQLSLDQRSGA